MHTEPSPCSPCDNKSSPPDCFMLSEAPALTTVHFMPIVRRSFFASSAPTQPSAHPPTLSVRPLHSTKKGSCMCLIKKLALTRGKMLAATGGNQCHQMVPSYSCKCVKFLIWQNTLCTQSCHIWVGGGKAKNNAALFT